MASNLLDSPPNAAITALWKRAMMDVVGGDRYTHAITLVWNRSFGIDRVRDDLRRFHRRVDKALLGSRCEQYPPDKRSRAFFVVEGIAHAHPHVHSVWRCPKGKLLEFNRLFPEQRGGLWNQIAPAGTYDVTLTNAFGRNDEIVGYLLKGQHRDSDASEMIWSDEFLPSS